MTAIGRLRTRRQRAQGERCALSVTKTRGMLGAPKAQRCYGKVSDTPYGLLCAHHAQGLERVQADALAKRAAVSARWPRIDV